MSLIYLLWLNFILLRLSTHMNQLFFFGILCHDVIQQTLPGTQ